MTDQRGGREPAPFSVLSLKLLTMWLRMGDDCSVGVAMVVLMRTVFFGPALLCAGIASPASASVIECQMERMGMNMGWVAPTIALNHDVGAATAKVSDGIILFLAGAPVDAKVATDNTLRTTYTWTVFAQDNSAQYANVSYRLTVRKADLTARIKVLPQGYSNNFDAGGKCRKIDG